MPSNLEHCNYGSLTKCKAPHILQQKIAVIFFFFAYIQVVSKKYNLLLTNKKVLTSCAFPDHFVPAGLAYDLRGMDLQVRSF